MSDTYTVGTILKNSAGQFTKILEIREGRYGICGWTTLKGAQESEVVTLFLNEFGIEACEPEVVEAGSVESDDTASDDNADAKPTKSKLKKLSEDDLKALAVEKGIEIVEDDTKSSILEKLYTHFEL